MSTTLNWHNHGSYQEVYGIECSITLQNRPAYCDRGNFIAQLFTFGNLASDIDECDGWPRYYFDETRAKLEVEAWLRKRGQVVSPDA